MNVIREGDSVRHKPSLQAWFILGVSVANDKVCASGWPPATGRLSDCELLERGHGISEEQQRYRNQEFGTDWDKF